jgi:hypothetical protein
MSISDPLFPLLFLVNSMFVGMLDALFQTSFLCMLLLFWVTGEFPSILIQNPFKNILPTFSLSRPSAKRPQVFDILPPEAFDSLADLPLRFDPRHLGKVFGASRPNLDSLR